MMTAKKRDFDAVASTWDNEGRRIKMQEDVFRAITKNIPSPSDMNVLDFGCGTGLLTLQLQPLVHSITGVDSSQGMLDVLSKKVSDRNLSNVRTLHLDLEHGGTLDEKYDLIVSVMTLHHIEKIKSLLSVFFNALAVNGYICLTDLDPDGGKFHENNDGVFHMGFDRAALRQDMIEAGFEDIVDETAAFMVKPDPSGGTRKFSLFLMTARKR